MQTKQRPKRHDGIAAVIDSRLTSLVSQCLRCVCGHGVRSRTFDPRLDAGVFALHDEDRMIRSLTSLSSSAPSFVLEKGMLSRIRGRASRAGNPHDQIRSGDSSNTCGLRVFLEIVSNFRPIDRDHPYPGEAAGRYGRPRRQVIGSCRPLFWTLTDDGPPL